LRRVGLSPAERRAVQVEGDDAVGGEGYLGLKGLGGVDCGLVEGAGGVEAEEALGGFDLGARGAGLLGGVRREVERGRTAGLGVVDEGGGCGLAFGGGIRGVLDGGGGHAGEEDVGDDRAGDAAGGGVWVDAQLLGELVRALADDPGRALVANHGVRDLVLVDDGGSADAGAAEVPR
jgi:hypothetical protein